jgi:hypothetical protein|tara:strand:+ start:2536 stop:2760 length:225 start_codon:yes stop_codon:yes gene_type:complete
MKELKTQLITAVGLIITAGAALLVTNMEAWFSPDEPVVIEQVIEPSKTVKDTIIITKIIKPVVIEKKKEREIDW